MKNNVPPIVLSAKPHAAQAVTLIQQCRACVREYMRLNKTLNLIWKSLLDAHAELYTALYFILLGLDSFISIPLIRAVTNDGQKLPNPLLWEVIFFLLYFFLIGAITVTAADYFALKFSRRHWNLQVELRLLFNPGKRRPELEMEMREEVERKYRFAIGMTVFMVVFLTWLCAIRVYIVNDRQWNFRPIDCIQFLPVFLALTLIFLGRYKAILWKKMRWTMQRRRLVRQYHRARVEADGYVDIVIDYLQSAAISMDDPGLPVEIHNCIDYYRNKNPFEILDSEVETEPNRKNQF